MDFGTGDGAHAYYLAKNHPETLVIGADSNAENLRETSYRASRKPAKGGLPNALFAQLSLEDAPGPLAGLADSISVVLPWGSLLTAVAKAEPETLARLVALAKPGAKLEVIFGYGAAADPGMVLNLALPALTAHYVAKQLPAAYRAAGITASARAITTDEVRALPTTWAKKLAYSGKARTFVKVTGVVSPSARA